MGIWPQRTEVIDMPARISVSTSLLPDDYDWLHDEAHRVGLSMSRILADIVFDYRVSIASIEAHNEAMARILTDEDELRDFERKIEEEG